jgi:hypothetical protein
MRHQNDGIITTGGNMPSNDMSDAKRRKIRKGTSSCWECKRRKARCNFASPRDTSCVSCRRRGVACVSQEYEEQPSQQVEVPLQMRERIGRVEAQMSEIAKHIANAPGSVSSADVTIRGQITSSTTDEAGANPAPLTPIDSSSESGVRRTHSREHDASTVGIPPHMGVKMGN